MTLPIIAPTMKRDMDLIRLLMMRVAGEDVELELQEYANQTCAFHWALLMDAGYVIGVVSTDENGFPNRAAITRLTWQGYEFLQLILNKTIWNRAKETILDKGVPWATPLLIEWLKAQACSHIPGLQAYIGSTQP